MANRIGELVAEPGFAPYEWQSAPPAPTFGHKKEVTATEDLARIVNLPRREPLEVRTPRAAALVQMISQRFGYHNPRCRCREMGLECITSLREVQAAALYEIGICRGLLGPIGVGHGKTILDLLAALAMPECKLAVLLVPPKLVTQLIGNYEHIGQHFRMPSLIVHGRDYTNIIPGQPVLHVFPYSRLSRADASDFLERLRPDTIIADEVHYLRHADTATTSRVLRYFAHHPETRFCGWSGSVTDASLEDYAHLCALALRWNSPLPLEPEIVKEWATAIDPSDWPAPPGALLALCAPGEHIHDGFHRRLVETLGVVHTTMAAIDAELHINERTAPPIPPHLMEMMARVRSEQERPDGETLVDQLSVSRVMRELACGFYYRWRYPLVGGQPQRVDVIETWLEARKAWHKELREKLKYREEHLDSPLLCARAAARAWGFESATEHLEDVEGAEQIDAIQAERIERAGKLPMWRSVHYPRWRQLRHTVVYETEAVRVDEYLARDAAAWAHEHRGIVWYDKREFGLWVAEISGLPMYGGGQNGSGGGLLDEHGRIREKGGRSIILSIQSHGTGRDGLQAIFDDQLVANPPASPTAWEQMLGRLHRIGQKAPVVRADFYRHTAELRAHVDKALARALYVQTTLGSAQKLRAGFRLE